jgi:hypothetical protein
VKTARATGDRAQLHTEIAANRSMWIAAVAFGVNGEPRNTKIAHSAPIYVIVDGETSFAKSEALPDLVAKQRALLQELLTLEVDPMGDLESWDTRDLLTAEWAKQRAILAPRIAEADARYRALLKNPDNTARR